MSPVDALPKNARVAVIRLRSLGDCVLTTPAIAILKKLDRISKSPSPLSLALPPCSGKPGRIATRCRLRLKRFRLPSGTVSQPTRGDAEHVDDGPPELA